MKTHWKQSLDSEVSFWKGIISGTNPHKDWIENFTRAAKGIDVAPTYIQPYLLNAGRILDVGAGPASVLGGICKGRKLNIIAVDPLAEEYRKLYEEYNVFPMVQPIKGSGETLKDVVTCKFDLVYSQNALDHGYDPILSIQNMIDVCASGGIVYAVFKVNVGERNKYTGLHSWNFMPAYNDMIVWTKDQPAMILSRYLAHNSYKTIKTEAQDGGRFSILIRV